MFAAAVLVSFLYIIPGILGQTVRLAGDSTMAKGGGGKGTDGKTMTLHLLGMTLITDSSDRLGTIFGTIPHFTCCQ